MGGSLMVRLVLAPFVLWNVGSDLIYPPYETSDILYSAHTTSLQKQLTTPIDVFSSNGVLHVTLTTQVYRAANDLFSYNTRAYCFNLVCSIPGPTLHLKPGDELRVTIINQLGDDLLLSSGSNANHTNLEVYGVRFDSSPVTALYATASHAGSRVLLEGSSAGYGQTLTYSATVSAAHAPGTHWYRSHVPGSSALQVMGGLFGAVVVDPGPSYAVILSGILPAKQHLMLFSHVMLENSAGNIPGALDSSSTAWSLSRLSSVAGSSLPIKPEYSTSANVTIRDSWFTNGVYQPNVALTAGEWQLFDIVVASGDRLLELEVRSSFFSSAPAAQCSMRLLALDGVYLTSDRAETHLALLQGSRAAVAVQCSSNGTYYLMSASTVNVRSPYYPIGTLESKSVQILVSLAVTGTATAVGGFDLTTIPRPAYLSSLSSDSLFDSAPKVWSVSTAQAGCCGSSASLYWLGVGTDCTVPCLSGTTCGLLYGTAYTVADLPSVSSGMCAYSNTASRSVVTTVNGSVTSIGDDELQEISLWGLASSPFTMQIRGVHFQIEGYDNSNLDSHYDGANELDTAPDLSLLYGQIGDVRDTWPSLAGKVTLRALLQGSTGSSVGASVTTTILRYQDSGMGAELVLTTAATMTPPDVVDQNNTVPQSPIAQPLEGNMTGNSTAPPPPTDPFSIAVAAALDAALAAQSSARAELQRLMSLPSPPQLLPLEGHQTVIQFKANRSLAVITEQLSGLASSVELLPSSEEDGFITALTLDPDTDMVYFASAYGIFKVNASSSGGGKVVPVVTGLLSVTLVGFNLGVSPKDANLASLITVTAGERTCTSLRIMDTPPPSNGLPLPSYLTTLTCVVYSPGGSTVTPSDVTVSLGGGIGGSTTGAPSDLQPFASTDSLDAIRSGAGSRPTLLSVTLQSMPFKPQALFLLSSADSTSKAQKYLYWTDSDESAGTSAVYRCLLDGQRIETVLTQQREASLGLFVLSVPLSDYSAATSAATAAQLVTDLTATASRVGRGRTSLGEPQAAAVSGLSGVKGAYVDIVFFTQASESGDGSLSLLSYAACPPLDTSTAPYSKIGNASASSHPTLVQASEIFPVTVLPAGSPLMSIPTALTADKILNGYLFLSLLDGTVLRLSMAFTLSQPPLSSSPLPPWVTLLSGPRSSSRVSALYSIPATATSNSSSAQALRQAQRVQRVFSVDSNARSLVVCSEGGYSCTTVDLLSTGIVWPSAIAGPGSGISDSGSSANSTVAVSVYLAEALGKVWRVDLSFLASGGSFDRNVVSSRVVADISSYPSSLRIRGLLQGTAPQESSSSSSNQITFETIS